MLKINKCERSSHIYQLILKLLDFDPCFNVKLAYRYELFSASALF